jgi:hypothetical protein
VRAYRAIVMEAYETAKEEIDGENTVFEDLSEWWESLSLCGKKGGKDTVTPYDAPADGGEKDDADGHGDAMFSDNVSRHHAAPPPPARERIHSQCQHVSVMAVLTHLANDVGI